MTMISCPPSIRRWFKTEATDLELQLKDTLNLSQPMPSDVALWISKFSHQTLRHKLTMTGDSAIEQQRIWVCFAIRYLHPLLSNMPKLVSHEALTNIIKTHYGVIQILVEGKFDDVVYVLQVKLLEVGWVGNTENGYPDYLDKIADREERTFARSADKGRDQLIAELIRYFNTPKHNAIAESLRTYLSAKRPEQVHRALQSYYIRYQELLQESVNHPEDQHHIALSLVEFERRLDMINVFRAWDSRVLIGAEFIMVISVLGMDITHRTAFLLVMVLGFVIACLFYTRTAYAIADADSWARKELRMLDYKLR